MPYRVAWECECGGLTKYKPDMIACRYCGQAAKDRPPADTILVVSRLKLSMPTASNMEEWWHADS